MTRRNRAASIKEGWPVAPPILKEHYSMEDALAFGGMCISLLNHADRVTAACLAQLVNVIAPIMTETGGPAWRQTIFHPFAHFSRLGRGRVLRTEIDSPTYAARYNDPHGPIDEHFAIPAAPYLKLSAVHDDKAGTLTLFALNRSLDEAMPLRLDAGGFGKLAVRPCSFVTPTSRPSIPGTIPTASRRRRWPPSARTAKASRHRWRRRRGTSSAHGLNGRKICPTGRTADQAIVSTALPSTSRYGVTPRPGPVGALM